MVVKSVYVSEIVSQDVKLRKINHNFDFSAWVESVYKKEFMNEEFLRNRLTELKEEIFFLEKLKVEEDKKISPEEILEQYVGDLKRLYAHGVKKHSWTLSYEEFVKLKKV
jgi:uncharacterized Zn finger protein